jgi:hypothetical protein
MLDLFPSREAGPFGRRRKHTRGARIPVTVVTGFLGAGKTTLVRRFLATPAGAGTAVVVNEFGSVGIDDALLRASSERSRCSATAACAATPAPTCRSRCAISSPSARRAPCRSSSAS